MTLRRNRADRIHARRTGALDRLQAGLNIGVRFRDYLGDALHSDESRARASAEAGTLALLIAKTPSITFTRKRKVDGWSAARASRQSGKIAR